MYYITYFGIWLEKITQGKWHFVMQTPARFFHQLKLIIELKLSDNITVFIQLVGAVILHLCLGQATFILHRKDLF